MAARANSFLKAIIRTCDCGLRVMDVRGELYEAVQGGPVNFDFAIDKPITIRAEVRPHSCVETQTGIGC